MIDTQCKPQTSRYVVSVPVMYASGNYATAYLGYSSEYGKYLFSYEFEHDTLTADELNQLAKDGKNYWSLAEEVEE